MTVVFIVVVSFAVAVYDLACGFGALPFPTISSVVREWGRLLPWLIPPLYVAAAAYLFWHFFMEG